MHEWSLGGSPSLAFALNSKALGLTHGTLWRLLHRAERSVMMSMTTGAIHGRFASRYSLCAFVGRGLYYSALHSSIPPMNQINFLIFIKSIIILGIHTFRSHIIRLKPIALSPNICRHAVTRPSPFSGMYKVVTLGLIGTRREVSIAQIGPSTGVIIDHPILGLVCCNSWAFVSMSTTQ